MAEVKNPGVDALRKVREAGLGGAFMNDPVAAMKKAGVDTSGLRVAQTKAATGATHAACVSIGCGICSSVG